MIDLLLLLKGARRVSGRGGVSALTVAAAVAAAVLTEFLFDLGFSLARGTVLIFAYVALCGILMAAAGLACIAITARSPTRHRVGAALALYVMLHGVSDPLNTWDQGLGAVAMGGITWLFCGPYRPRRAGGLTLGTAIGAALCIAFVLWPYTEAVLTIPRVLQGQTSLVEALVFALVLVCSGLWESLRRGAFPLPSLASVSAAVLAVALGGTAFAYGRARPQWRELPDTSDPVSAASTPNVFLLVLDTVRADHLSSYGYPRPTTPNLQRFLAVHPEAIQYDLAFSPASWTIPAHASLLTGVMPSEHRARGGDGENLDHSPTEFMKLVADRTLAELLHEEGYCTGAAVANAFLLRVDGLQRGFEVFYKPTPTRPLNLLGSSLRTRFFPSAFAGRLMPYPLADVVSSHVLRLYRDCGPRPAFVLANYMDAHAPYLAPEPHAGVFAAAQSRPVPLPDAVVTDPPELIALKRDRYDEEIHFLDAELAVLLQQLEAIGVLQDSWVFIAADHGEAFLEHDTTSHGSSIYNEQVRIPLIVKPPRGVSLPQTEEPVSLLDVTTTIAAIAGHEGFGQGRDLRRPLAPGRSVMVEFTGGFRSQSDGFGAMATQPARAVVNGHFKLLERGGRYELYDLAVDPHEQMNRAPMQRERIEGLALDLPINLPLDSGRADGSGSATSLSADERETLRALGYLR